MWIVWASLHLIVALTIDLLLSACIYSYYNVLNEEVPSEDLVRRQYTFPLQKASEL